MATASKRVQRGKATLAARLKVRASFNPALRYDVPETSLLLGQCKAKTWDDIRHGRLGAIREGGRTFVSGADILKRCAPPSERLACA